MNAAFPPPAPVRLPRRRAALCLVVPLFALPLVGCGAPEEEDAEAAALVDAILALADGGGDAAPLHEDVLLVTPEGELVGAATASAALAGLRLSRDGAVEAHHDVVRARLTTEGGERQHLFVRREGGTAVEVVLLSTSTTSLPAPVEAYQQAWNATDATERLALLDRGFGAEARYVDPGTDVVGRPALSDAIGTFQGQLPTAFIQAEGAPMGGPAGWILFTWRIDVAGGVSLMDGFDVVRLDEDGVPLQVAGFFSALEPDAP